MLPFWVNFAISSGVWAAFTNSRSPRAVHTLTGSMERAIKSASIGSRRCRDDSLSRDACSFGFEFQGSCSAFTSRRARERDPKTFSLAAHNQELVLRHMTFSLQQIFQIGLERGLCFNHRIERFLHRGRQIICIDVLPLQFFPRHCLAPARPEESTRSLTPRPLLVPQPFQRQI